MKGEREGDERSNGFGERRVWDSSGHGPSSRDSSDPPPGQNRSSALASRSRASVDTSRAVFRMSRWTPYVQSAGAVDLRCDKALAMRGWICCSSRWALKGRELHAGGLRNRAAAGELSGRGRRELLPVSRHIAVLETNGN